MFFMIGLMPQGVLKDDIENLWTSFKKQSKIKEETNNDCGTLVKRLEKFSLIQKKEWKKDHANSMKSMDKDIYEINYPNINILNDNWQYCSKNEL